MQFALQLVRGALGDDAAAVDDRESGGELVGLLEVVGGEQDRHLLLARQPLDLPPELDPRLGVEPGRRLVEEEHLRPVDEAERDVETALHPARVGLRDSGRRLGQPETLEQLLNPLAARGAGQPVDLGLHLQVLAAARLRVEAVLLADDADRAAHGFRVADDIEAGHARLAAVRARERGQDLDRGRLAGSVRAEQPEDRARLDCEAEPVERADAARIRLPQVRCLDCFHAVLPSSYSLMARTF